MANPTPKPRSTTQPTTAAVTPKADGETQKAIALLTQMMAESGEELAKQAPRQLEKMKRLLGELKAGRGKAGAGSQTAELVRDLFSWQLEVTRNEYAGRLNQLAPAAATGDVTAGLAKKALEGVMLVLDEALSAMRNPGTRSTATLEATAARATAALNEADAALQKAHEPVLKPVRSAPGVPALKAVEPHPFSAAHPITSSQVVPADSKPAPFKPSKAAPMPVKPRPAAQPPAVKPASGKSPPSKSR